MNYVKLMKRAISLADQYKYTAKPNPVVGCIIVKGKEIISEGAHEKFGCNHAEINAINSAKFCLLYTSPSPRDRSLSRMPSSA